MEPQIGLGQRSVNHYCPNFKNSYLTIYIVVFLMNITYLCVGCHKKENEKQRLHFILHAKILLKWILQKKEKKKKDN